MSATELFTITDGGRRRAANETVASGTGSRSTEIDRSPSRILLVVDHAQNRELLGDALSEPYSVVVPRDFDDSFAHPHDLYVLDREAFDPDGWVTVSVADNGPGVPDGQYAVLERGEETTLAHANGLGLWIVYWIVRRAGGELSVSDGDDTGTTVTMRLPTVDPEGPVASRPRGDIRQ